MRSRLLLTVLALATLAVPGAPTAGAADGGVWTSTLQATQAFDHLSAFPDGTSYAQYLDSYARSTDAGLTWQVMPKPPGHYYGGSGIRFASPEVGVAVGGNPGLESAVTGPVEFLDEIKRCGDISPLRKTTDGGATWRALCVPNATQTSNPRWAPHVAPLAFAAGGRTIMVSGNEEPPLPDLDRACHEDNDVIYTSHDGGGRWIRAALPQGWYSGYRQAAYDSSTLVRIAHGEYEPIDATTCGSETSGVFLSRDGGRSFRRVLTCPRPVCTSIALVSRTKFIVGRADGSTLVTENGGRRWYRGQRLFDPRWQPVIDSGQLPAEAFWVQGLSFSDAKHGFASTRGSGTWRTADGGSSWTQERSHECLWYLHGVGEVAAGSPDTAITGGPHFISARTPLDAAPEGCAVVRPEAPALAGDLVATGATLAGTVGVRVDGAVTVTRS